MVRPSTVALAVLLVGTTATADLEGFGSINSGDVPIETSTIRTQVSNSLSWDEDEFEGMDILEAAARAATSQSYSQEATATPQLRLPRDNYYPEIIAGLFLVAYGVIFFWGKAENEKIATSFCNTFAREGCVFDRNFAMLGTTEGAELMAKESQSNFRFYASGRRYCQGLLATLDLRRRQDLLAYIWQIVNPQDDKLDIEVHMNDANMVPMVLLIAQPKLAKEMHKDYKDLEEFAHEVTVTRDRIANWPGERLSVLAEQASIFYDLMVDQILELIFNRAAFEPLRRYFKYMYFTTENPDLTHKRTLKFSFLLPSAKRMEDISKLMAAVTLFIDIVGNYKLSADQQKRSDKVRQDLEKSAFKETQQQRNDALAQRKAEKLQEEKERLKKLTPEARRKLEEKKQRQEQKRSAKVKLLKG